MGVYQLKDGRWIVQYKENDKTRREYFGRGPEAEKRARQRQDSLGLRSYTKRTPQPKTPLFEALAQAYIDRKYIDLPEESFTAMFHKIKSVILPELGHLPITQITAHRLDQYVGRRLKAGRKKTTIHRELSDIQAILNWSVRQGYIMANPVAGYEKPARDDEIIQPVTPAEARKIIKNAPPHLARALYISYYTGLRPGRRELLSLTWERVDFDGNTILVISAKKGGLKYRTVPLHRRLREMLEKWKKEDLARNPVPENIIHWRGQAIKSIKKSFNNAKKHAGIKRKLTPYAFRHAFISAILAKGGDLKSTSEIAGHSRPDTTQRIYQHTNTKLHRASINKLPDL